MLARPLLRPLASQAKGLLGVQGRKVEEVQGRQGVQGVQGVQEREVHSLPASFTKRNQWNKAVSEAEKLVGYPTSLLSVRALLDNDFAHIAVHLRKLIGSNHPVLRTAKRLIYHGKNKMQVRGLMVLLLSRAVGSKNSTEAVDQGTGVLESQRKLAEIVEMINTAQSIHQSVVNVPVNISLEEDEEVRTVLAQLEYGNKISILSGDYLLANACVGLAGLRVTKIVEIVSIAIAEFTQAEFLGLQDPQGRLVPTAASLSAEWWRTRATLGSGGLLASGCQGAMLLAGAEELEEPARQLGLHLALALRAHDERQTFTTSGGRGGGAPFCLASAPVLLHLQSDPSLLEYIQGFQGDLSTMDYRRVYDKVVDSPTGMELALELCREEVDACLTLMEKLEDNEATSALRNVVTSLSTPA